MVLSRRMCLSERMSKRVDFAKERRAQGRSLSGVVRELVALIQPVANQQGIDLQERLNEASARKSEERRLLAERLQELCRLGWKWRTRSSVKITERAREENTKALHRGRESRHLEAAFAGAGSHYSQRGQVSHRHLGRQSIRQGCSQQAQRMKTDARKFGGCHPVGTHPGARAEAPARRDRRRAGCSAPRHSRRRLQRRIVNRTLHLNLHREFFAAIAAKKKRIEYRDQTAYWKKRLEGRRYDLIQFRTGYVGWK